MGSEPESEKQAASPALCSHKSRCVPRSCYGCNSKKVRCDKTEPCSSCARAGRPCVYPPLGPRKRRAKTTIMADIASRIASLEKSVDKVRRVETSVPTILTSETANATRSTQQAKTAHSGNLSERSREDILVQKGSSSQYFNEILLSRIIEEERNVESVLTPPQTESPHPPVSSPFNALGILSSVSPSVVPARLHPSTQLAASLWRVYVQNLESCIGLKLLHLPTDEIKVYSTIDDPSTASPDNLALSFAIYFAATASLDGPEAQVVLEQDKHKLLLRFKVGLEQAFAYGDFLDRPTLTALHALAIYLSTLRVHNHGKGLWVLHGLAIRIAQSLGLHRDGERLGLSPFQSEIRRRLWYHLLSRDGRAGEDYGLQNINSLLLVSDVSLPANVDDTDLYPEMQWLPAAKEGWTAMTFSLIHIDLAKAMQMLADVAASSSHSSPPSEDVRAQVIKKTELRMEKWLAHCNPVVPHHRMTLLCSRFVLRKLDFVTRLQWSLLQRADPHTDFATEKNLTEALGILKPRLYSEDGLLRQFAWVRKAYPQYYVVMYVLWHLCVKPEGPSVETAWETVESMFSSELWDESTVGFGSKSAVLVALRAKAVLVRDRIRKAKSSERSSGPGFGGSAEGKDFSTCSFGDVDGDDVDLGDTDEWTDWAALVQGFEIDGPDVYWQ